MIVDKTGRKFESLRVSLTQACNFSCVYCVSEEEKDMPVKRAPVMKASEITALVQKIHKVNPLKEVRLTGGEPLLYKDLKSVVEEVTSLGLDVKMTTNAVLLKARLRELLNAGLKSINVSMDAADPEIFNRITRSSNYNHVVKGIEAALEAGLEVKLNAVIIKGINDSQILPLLKFAGKYKIVVRFLELMEMGHLYENHHEKVYTESEILNRIAEEYGVISIERNPSATAKYWLTDSLTMFGIISNHSDPFCQDCNRLRLDSSGNIFGCLSSNFGISINEASDDQLKEKLKLALKQKKEAFTGSNLSMKYIGG